MTSDSNRVLAFFGSDLALRHGQRFLQRLHRKGYALLALDSHAMAQAARARLPHTTADDWLAPADIAGALQRAWEALGCWFEPARDDFTVEGICWPEVDASAMKWFWSDAFLALELAEALRYKNSSLAFFRNLFPRAAVGHDRSDTCDRMWAAEAQGSTPETFLLLDQLAPRWSNRAMERLLGVFSRSSEDRQSTVEKEISEGSIILVMGPEEEVRFSHLAVGLSNRFPGKVAAVIAGARSSASTEIAEGWGVPVVYGPKWPAYRGIAALPASLLPQPDRKLAARFLSGYRTAVEAARGQPWQKPLEHLAHHFNYYCLYRWPYLVKEVLGFWRNLWRRSRPAGVVITSRDETVFALASIAARDMGIMSFCVPHGGNSGFKRDCSPLVNDWVLCNSPLQKSRFAMRGIPPERIVECRGLLAQNEYRMSPVPTFPTTDRWRVLVLTEATGEGVNLVKYTSLSAQAQALQIVTQAPDDIADRVEVRIKVHPHISDLEILEAAGSEVTSRVLPLKSDLHAALESADLVVGLNYRGTALIHAMGAGKPIVQLVTEPSPLWNRPDFPFEILRDGSAVAHTADEFWKILRSYLTSPQVADEMRCKSEAFYLEHLDDRGFPPWWDVVRDRLRDRSPRQLSASL